LRTYSSSNRCGGPDAASSGGTVAPFRDAVSGPGGAAGGGIGLEQKARRGPFQGGGLAGGDDRVQGLTFRNRERALVLLHGGFLPFRLN